MSGERRDVSGRAVAAVVKALERDGKDLSRLVEGTGRTLDELHRTSGSWWDWESFARFLNNVGELVGGEAGLDALGRALLSVESWSFVRRIARYTLTPSQLFSAGTRVFAPAIFPCIEQDIRDVPPRGFKVQLSIPVDRCECEEFFFISRGQLCALSSVLGLPDADMKAEITGRRATYWIQFPPSPSVPRLALRWIRAMAASPSSLTELLTEHREFMESVETGERTRRDLMEFVDRLPDGVSFQDGSRLVYANPAMLAILGRDASEVVGHSAFEFIHPGDHRDTEERLALKDNYPNDRVDVRIQRPDGSTVITTLERGQWVDFEGRRVRLSVCRDVTEARRIQAQLMQSDRMASLGTLAAGVAHEINNPLAWLHNAALALERDIGRLSSEEPPTQEVVERMRESVSAALEGTSRVRMIVRDLRTFSRPDDESVESVDVRDVLRGAIRVSSKELSSRAHVREHYGDVPRVIGNSARLGQVFLNLILNAAQAVDEGAAAKSEVGVRAYPDGEYVVVEVQDAGRGIPGHLLPRIFEPFFTTKGGDGTGLGLAISHRIVTRLGGRIEVESVEGEGTLFRVVLCSVPSSLTDLQ